MPKPAQIEVFNSFSAFGNHVLTGTPAFNGNAEELREHRTTGTRSGTSWSGHGGPIETVYSDLQGGWPEGVEKVRKEVGRIELPPIPSIRRHPVRGPEGDEVDPHRVLAGDIDRAWATTKRGLRFGPGRVRVVVNICEHAGVSAEQIKWKGIAALALTEALTAAGYAVRVDVVAYNRDLYPGCAEHMTIVTVKQYNAPYTLAALVAMVAHPAAYRRMMFSSWCITAKGKINYGLGQVGQVTAEEYQDVIPAGLKDNVPTVAVPLRVQDVGAAKQWVYEALETLGLAQGVAA